MFRIRQEYTLRRSQIINTHINCQNLFLEPASIFFGWLGIILNSLMLIVLTSYFLFSSFFDAKDVNQIGEYNGTDVIEIEKSGLSPGFKIFLVGVLYVTIVFKLGVSKLLIDGTRKRNSRYIKPWLIVNAITTLIECISIPTIHSTILLLTSFGNINLYVFLFNQLNH